MAENEYRTEQLQERLANMNRFDMMRAISAIDELAPDAVAKVFGLTDTARFGDDAHSHQAEVIARVQDELKDHHLGTSDSYDMIDDFSELVTQDMQLADSGEYAAGIGQILAIIQLFPWFEDRTRKVISVGMAGMWLDSVAENLAPFPDTDDAKAAVALVDAAIADPKYAGVQKYLEQFRVKIAD